MDATDAMQATLEEPLQGRFDFARPSRPARRRRSRPPWRDASFICERPDGETPRERLLCCGPAVLSDAELVGVVLGRGASPETARGLLERFGGLPGVATARPVDLLQAGFTKAQSAALAAVGELARRLLQAELRARNLLGRPSEVANYLALRYCGPDQEVMGALFLDVKNQLIGEREIFRGTLSRAAVEPRQILREALALGAAGILLFHNHPTGDPTPSAEDLLFTRRMAQAGDMLDVRLVDHLIIGGAGRWISLKQRRVW
jgi:DNA repair protein RadC